MWSNLTLLDYEVGLLFLAAKSRCLKLLSGYPYSRMCGAFICRWTLQLPVLRYDTKRTNLLS